MKTSLKGIARKAIRAINAREMIPIDRIVSNDEVLSGKVALISGGTGGIGMAVARQLHESGASVILGGTNAEKLQRCAREISDPPLKTIELNLSEPDSIIGAIEKANSFFGHIDIFINSAGVHTEEVSFWTMTPEEYDRVMNINLRGAFLVSQAVARQMVDSKIRGHILLVNSSRGFEPAWSPYGISKWGLRGFTKGLAQVLLPYGIVVNAIAPGSTATPLIGFSSGDSIDSTENHVGRLATSDEIATWVKMLVSGTGDMVVGETLLVSGGRGSIDIR